jgi:hypothetical protein
MNYEHVVNLKEKSANVTLLSHRVVTTRFVQNNNALKGLFRLLTTRC